MSYKHIRHRLTDRLVEIASARIGFYRRGQHCISTDDGAHQWLPSADASAAKWLILVGREYYFESVRDYPIGHLNDLRKVLKNEPWRFPFKGLCFKRIQRVGEQVHRVTSWVIKPEVLDSLANRPLWVIPESALLEFLTDEKPIALNTLGETLFVAATADGLVSSLGQEAAFLHRIGTSASGNAGDSTEGITRLAGTQAINAQLRGVVWIFKIAPQRFWAGVDTRRLYDYSWRRAAALCAGIFTLYMALTSAYLVAVNQWVDYRLRADTSAAESSMLARRDLATYRTRFETMQSMLLPWPPIWVAWDVFLDMKANGVGFRAVNMSAASATYYITSERATDVLDWLSRDRRIASAEFALPVRKVRNTEQCAIVVKFNAMHSSDLDASNSDVLGDQTVPPEAITNKPLVDRPESAGDD